MSLAVQAVNHGHTAVGSCAGDLTASCRLAYPGLQSPLRLSCEWESSAILGLCPFSEQFFLLSLMLNLF